MSDVRAEFVPDDWDGKDGADMCMAVFVDGKLGYVWSDEHPMYLLVRDLKTRLEQADALLQRSKIAVLEADSDFSAYAAGRSLDKESAGRVSWMCRQLYSDIKKWLLDHNGGSTDMKQG